jgi:ATP-dependent protease Clp ATPase subunit
VKKLVCGPAVYICNDCIARAQRVVTSSTPVENRRTAMASVPAAQATERCNFCGKPRRQVTALVSGPGHRICDACLRICQEITAEQLQ